MVPKVTVNGYRTPPQSLCDINTKHAYMCDATFSRGVYPSDESIVSPISIHALSYHYVKSRHKLRRLFQCIVRYSALAVRSQCHRCECVVHCWGGARFNRNSVIMPHSLTWTKERDLSSNLARHRLRLVYRACVPAPNIQKARTKISKSG